MKKSTGQRNHPSNRPLNTDIQIFSDKIQIFVDTRSLLFIRTVGGSCKIQIFVDTHSLLFIRTVGGSCKIQIFVDTRSLLFIRTVGGSVKKNQYTYKLTKELHWQ